MNENGIEIRIDYDDNAIDIIENISGCLEQIGYEIVFDELEHDGFEICYLRKINQ